MGDDEVRVNDLLEQSVDHAALRLSTEPSDALDADLLARLQRLKAAPLVPKAPQLDADGLQSDLAERLAALKKHPSKAPAPEIIKTAKLSNPNRIAKEMHEGEAFDVEKLLESVHDCVRLEKSGEPKHIHDWLHLEKSGAPKPNHNNESDEEISDSEVDRVVEWAKDAAVLEKDEEEEASDADLPITPPAAQSPQSKKKGSRWKFW